MRISEENLSLVDQILTNSAKVLDAYQPHWTYQPGYDDYQLAWPVLEEDSGRERSQIRIRLKSTQPQYPSISYIVSGSTVCRIDKDDEDTCKANPVFASRLGLPHRVCGVHLHDWADNRQHILDSGIWEVPARKPVVAKLINLNDLFFWFCNHINVRIQPHNTPLSLPDFGLWRH